jgi:NADH:ubiquinone oxidoreductase subunit E
MGLPVHDQYDLEQTIHTIVNRYGGKAVGLIMVLQDVQKHYRYLPVEALKLVAQKMTLPIAQVYAVATFYKSFSLTPKGKHHICVCTGTACHGQTTPDGEISYETVNCLGACALGPLVTVDDEYHGNMTVTKMGKLMDELLGRQTPVEEKVEETA